MAWQTSVITGQRSGSLRGGGGHPEQRPSSAAAETLGCGVIGSAAASGAAGSGSRPGIPTGGEVSRELRDRLHGVGFLTHRVALGCGATGSATDLGSVGSGFESRRPNHHHHDQHQPEQPDNQP